MTGPELGVGTGLRLCGKFRDIQVAVKRIHNYIISHHNLQFFQRERGEHGSKTILIQFISATMEVKMMLMELMATYSRIQLQRERYF